MHFYTQHTPVSHLAFPSYLKNCFLVTSSGEKKHKETRLDVHTFLRGGQLSLGVPPPTSVTQKIKEKLNKSSCVMEKKQKN